MRNLLLADYESFEIKELIEIKGGEGIILLSGSTGDENDDSEGV